MQIIYTFLNSTFDLALCDFGGALYSFSGSTSYSRVPRPPNPSVKVPLFRLCPSARPSLGGRTADHHLLLLFVRDAPSKSSHTRKFIPPIVISEVSKMATGDDDSQTSGPRASERSAARRRQVRKGTRSCWECRRRKIRCVFDGPGGRDTCRTCWEKGTPCVGQEFPEDEVPHVRATVGSVVDRLGRMERLVEQLYHRESPGKSPVPQSNLPSGTEEGLPLQSSIDVAGGACGEPVVDDGDGLVARSLVARSPPIGDPDSSTLQVRIHHQRIFVFTFFCLP